MRLAGDGLVVIAGEVWSITAHFLRRRGSRGTEWEDDSIAFPLTGRSVRVSDDGLATRAASAGVNVSHVFPVTVRGMSPIDCLPVLNVGAVPVAVRAWNHFFRIWISHLSLPERRPFDHELSLGAMPLHPASGRASGDWGADAISGKRLRAGAAWRFFEVGGGDCGSGRASAVRGAVRQRSGRDRQDDLIQ